MSDLNRSLSRRSLLQFAAPAAVALSSKPAVSALLDLRPKPQQIDLIDPDSDAAWRKNPRVGCYVLCEEMQNPGQLSGCRIVAAHSGDNALLSVYMGPHCLGSMCQPSIPRFMARIRAEEKRVTERLKDIHEAGISTFSGINLECHHWKDTGREMPELCVVNDRWHYFGVVRGRKLRALLDCLALRLEVAS